MNAKIILPAFSVAALLLCELGAIEPAVLEQPIEAIVETGGKEKPTPIDKDKKTVEKKSPESDLFTQTPTMGNQFATGFNPHMMGDFGAFFVRQTFTSVGTQTTTKTTTRFVVEKAGPKGVVVIQGRNTTTTTNPVTQTRTIVVPVALSAAAFKVAENESPRPVDRVFGEYNYFGGIRGPDNGPATNPVVNTFTTTPLVVGPGTSVATNANAIFPAPPRVTANLHREIFGFEKTFLDGFASIELRIPFLQQSSNVDGFAAQNAGDLTIVTKYAFLLDNPTGNVISGGLAITVPTGPGIDTIDGPLHATLIQPWFGYIWNFQGCFVQAFHSVVVPTDDRMATLLFNDVALNYWLYRSDSDRFLNFVVPMIEAHLTTPLNQRSPDAPVYVPDMLVLTGGVHVGVMSNTTLSFGVATPITGPRLYNVEAFLQFNRRF